MDRVVPVVVVTGRGAVPPAVVLDQCRVGPVDTGVGAGHDDVLTGDAGGPDFGRADFGDTPFDSGYRLERAEFGLGQAHPDLRVAQELGDVVAFGEGRGDGDV